MDPPTGPAKSVGPTEWGDLIPMAEKSEKPEGHCRCCSKRIPPHRRAVRWLGPVVYTVYKIVRDYGPL